MGFTDDARRSEALTLVARGAVWWPWEAGVADRAGERDPRASHTERVADEWEMWGDSDDQPLRRETVRFVGGPWDGQAARYVDIDDHGDMLVPDGRYRFEDINEFEETIYVFRHGHDTTT